MGVDVGDGLVKFAHTHRVCESIYISGDSASTHICDHLYFSIAVHIIINIDT